MPPEVPTGGLKHFRSGINIHRTRVLPGADIGSDNDLMMMFRVHLKKARKPNQPRLRFALVKVRDPYVTCAFQASTCRLERSVVDF